jgi:4'-phosphopantetheinyl transferase
VIDGVHVWVAALDRPGWPPAAELPAAERERAARFASPQVARRWVASRWALRCVLGRYLDQPPSEVELELGEYGKPRLRGKPLEFNLSHSEGLALVAAAERAVGVDVEAVRPGRDALALAQRALSTEEAAAVRAASPQEREAVFYRAWTRHEARLKCRGTTPAQTPVTVVQLDLAAPYTAAVAAAGPEPFSPRLHPIQWGWRD